jgi:dihydropyrimidine dehydrogenase (NAD+) subunit PreA
MGSAVSSEPKVLLEIARWAVEFATKPVIIKLSPNVTDIVEPGEAVLESGAHAISLINTVKSIMGVDLERMVPMPRVGNGSTNGGYCGPAVKPIALHMVGELTRHPGIAKLPISGIGGISNWRDAAEFIALGCTSVQVCTAVMHYGYRIVEDMIEGLNDFLDSRGMKSILDLRGKATSAYKVWGELDLAYRVVADISVDKCIGCQLCYVACMDGAHQCIHLPGRTEEEARKAGHIHIPKLIPERAVTAKAGIPGARVPYVDEDECIGCNLCQLVCPVAGCITMKELSSDKPHESWNDRVQKGTDFVPGGLRVTEEARAKRST